jgi:hypothetical protein
MIVGEGQMAPSCVHFARQWIDKIGRPAVNGIPLYRIFTAFRRFLGWSGRTGVRSESLNAVSKSASSMCWFLFKEFHTVRLVSRKVAKTIDPAINPIKTALKRGIRAWKMVAGAGFEPAIPPRRDYEPECFGGSPVIR